MKINSIKYTENEIYTSMIKLFKDEEISKIIITDNILRIRYGGIKKDKINFDRQKAEKITLLYLKNKDFKYNLDLVYKEYWDELVNYKEELKTREQAEEIYSEYFVEEYNPLVLCAMLWNTEFEELNKFADEIYGEQIKGKEEILRDIIRDDIDDEDEKKEQTISKKSDESATVSLDKDKIKAYEDKIKQYENEIFEYEKKLAKKDKMIEQIVDKINKNDEAKAMKKEMKNLTREILEMSKLVSDNLSKANKTIFDLEKRNAEIIKELSRQSKALEKVNKKIDLNDQTNVINGIKSYVKLSMKQEREEMLCAFSKLLDDKLNKNCYMDSDDLGQKLVSDFYDSNIESNNEKIKKVNNMHNNDSSGIFDEDVEAMFNGLNLD